MRPLAFIPGAAGWSLGAFEQDSDGVNVLFKQSIPNEEWAVGAREDMGTPTAE